GPRRASPLSLLARAKLTRFVFVAADALIHHAGRIFLPRRPDDARGHPGDGRAGRYRMQDDGSRGDLGACPDLYIAEDLRPCPDEDAVTNLGMAVAALLAGAAERHLL